MILNFVGQGLAPAESQICFCRNISSIVDFLYNYIIILIIKKINSLFVIKQYANEQYNGNMVDKMDIRIKRTKKMLSDALLELLKTKPIEKITPTELCRAATINRNTFYTHYKSTSEVLDEIENELLDTVDESINSAKTPVGAIESLCEMLRKNRKLTSIIFNTNSGNKIVEKAFQITNKFNQSKMDEKNNTLDKAYRDMLSIYTISGSASVIKYWVQNGMREEPKAVADFIFTASKYGSSKFND